MFSGGETKRMIKDYIKQSLAELVFKVVYCLFSRYRLEPNRGMGWGINLLLLLLYIIRNIIIRALFENTRRG